MDKHLERIDSRIDGELTPAEAREIDAHLDACAGCRAERDSRAALKQALGRLRLPPAPRRITMGDLQPARRWRWTAAAAAIVVIAIVLFSLPAPLPPLVALSVRLHEDYLGGALAPADLGLTVSRPIVNSAGDCSCCRGIGASSPFVVYRKGNVPITLLIVEAEPGPLPVASRRSIGGREVHAFHVGGEVAIVCPWGKLCQVWVARLEEAELLRAIQPLFNVGVGMPTREAATCQVCCSVLDSRKPGVKDPVPMEKADLVLAEDGGRVDLQKVIRAIQSLRGTR
jgi:hypothetical protein